MNSASLVYERVSLKLEAAEVRREAGLDDNSLKSLAQVIDEASIFLEESVPEGDSEAEDEEEEEEEYYVHQLIKLRAVACYQLALSSFQLSKSPEGDDYLHKLGFKLRLSDEVLKYNGNRPLHPPPPPTSLPPSHCIIDEALPSSLFSQLHESFAASEFWSAHGYPTDRFFSYNLPLSPPSFPSLLHQLSSTVRSLLLPSFPSLESASSAEIWAHSRTSEGHHQLHYDLDEVALARGEICSPIVSTVLFLETIAGGSPTLVCNKKINEEDRGDGYLCEGKPNRLLAFDGSLLHAVVPGIPAAPLSSPPPRRITVMIGFWGSGVNTTPTPTKLQPSDNLRPNMVLSNSHSWLASFAPISPLPPLPSSAPKVMSGEYVPKVWVSVKPSSEASSSFEEYHDEEVYFTGRFFLRTNSSQGVDDEVLSGMPVPPTSLPTPPSSPPAKKKRKASR
ncbi:hypothetical protein TrCOL_g10365 [Triparma columacea]|uniref:Uncharacterized protein n=1 Tax=Triparma columacea TaxID=722753 RepID=A0A9W7GLH9_9STRA|nr:hypothetical protein TrCOL_g10365 [Triparma columacea]